MDSPQVEAPRGDILIIMHKVPSSQSFRLLAALCLSGALEWSPGIKRRKNVKFLYKNTMKYKLCWVQTNRKRQQLHFFNLSSLKFSAKISQPFVRNQFEQPNKEFFCKTKISNFLSKILNFPSNENEMKILNLERKFASIECVFRTLVAFVAPVKMELE